MNKLTQWIIIGLLALNVLGTFLLIRKVEVSAEDTRIGIINRDRENTNNIIAEIGKSNIQLDKIQQNTWELQDVLLDDFSYYMKQMVNK